MGEQQVHTIQNFYESLQKGKLVSSRCRKCGGSFLPPRPVCSKCFSTEFDLLESPRKGKLLTYTIIHVAPPEFQKMVPYAVGIVQLDDGLKIPGMILNVKHKEIEIGMNLSVEIEASQWRTDWPQWPRYHFRKPKRNT